MRLIGVLDQDETVPCASCHHPWNVRYLLKDLGQHGLRPEGFAFIWFDDDAISVNYCPRCEVPAMVRVREPTALLAVRLAA